MNLFVIIVAAILLALFIRKRPGMALRLLALLLLAFVLWAVIHSRTGLPPSEMRGRRLKWAPPTPMPRSKVPDTGLPQGLNIAFSGRACCAESNVQDEKALSKFVSQQNIGRYERLLGTYLTDLEREFVERRLAEERQTLRSAEAETLSRVGDELKRLRPMLKASVAVVFSNVIEFSLSSFDLVEQVGLI